MRGDGTAGETGTRGTITYNFPRLAWQRWKIFPKRKSRESFSPNHSKPVVKFEKPQRLDFDDGWRNTCNGVQKSMCCRCCYYYFTSKAFFFSFVLTHALKPISSPNCYVFLTRNENINKSDKIFFMTTNFYCWKLGDVPKSQKKIVYMLTIANYVIILSTKLKKKSLVLVGRVIFFFDQLLHRL